MKTDILCLRGIARCTLAGAVAMALPLSAVAAQDAPPANTPGGPPALGGPPAAGGAPGRGPSGPGGQAGGQGSHPPGPPQPPLTETQKLVNSLTPPNPGFAIPLAPIAKGAPMPSSDPRDFSGTWFHGQGLVFRIQRDMYGEPAPYTMAGAKVLARRIKSLDAGKPYVNASATCRPPGTQWQFDLNFPFQVFQTKDWLRFVFEEYHGRWSVAFDPSKLPQGPSYQGRSVARWDGDTLVVETTGFKQDLWLDVDGTPFSASGKLTQRIRKVTGGGARPYLEIITTIEDPKYYEHAWSVARSYVWMPQAAYFGEYNCEEQVGDPSVSADAGLVPEPKD